MPQGIENAFCHHSHPLKCTLDTTERNWGKAKMKQNKTKAEPIKERARIFVEFKGMLCP